MSKETDSTQVTSLVTLNASAKGRIVKALETAYVQVAGSGGSAALALCAEISIMIPKGQMLADNDLTEIVRGVAQRRGWKADTLKSRKTEIRTIINASRDLSPAIQAWVKGENGSCGWHNVVKLARMTLKGHKGEAAYKAAKKKKKPTERVVSPKARAAILLKALLKTKGIPGALRSAVLKLAVDHHLNVGATA